MTDQSKRKYRFHRDDRTIATITATSMGSALAKLRSKTGEQFSDDPLLGVYIFDPEFPPEYNDHTSRNHHKPHAR